MSILNGKETESCPFANLSKKKAYKNGSGKNEESAMGTAANSWGRTHDEGSSSKLLSFLLRNNFSTRG